jgi:hypothetical protein
MRTIITPSSVLQLTSTPHPSSSAAALPKTAKQKKGEE